MTGWFIPLFYVYAVFVVAFRIISCAIILRKPKAFLQYILVEKNPQISIISILNSACKSITFSFGCLIVATLYGTVQILKSAHLHETTMEQGKRRSKVFNWLMTFFSLYMFFEDILLYFWDPWTIEIDAISDVACFTLLSVLYVAVVCYLFRNLSRINLLEGSLNKEKDEILNQFYVFEIMYFTRALFNIFTFLMWDASDWYILSIVFACVTIPFWDIIPIGYVLYIHRKMFLGMEQARVSHATFITITGSDESYRSSFRVNNERLLPQKDIHV